MARSRCTRRRFCRLVLFVPLGVLLGWPGCAGAPVYRGRLTRGRIIVRRDWLDSVDASVNALIVTTPELADPILLISHGDEGYAALSVRCTHQGCHVRRTGGVLSCPCHGSTYDLHGHVVRGPAPSDLRRYPVRMTNKGLEILIDTGG